MSKKEWQVVRSLANDCNTVIKKADEDSCVVIWDRLDYIMKAEKQLSDKTVNKDVTIIPNLTENRNKIFKNLEGRGFISENNLSTSDLILKTLAIWENSILSLKFINVYRTYLGDL